MEKFQKFFFFCFKTIPSYVYTYCLSCAVVSSVVSTYTNLTPPYQRPYSPGSPLASTAIRLLDLGYPAGNSDCCQISSTLSQDQSLVLPLFFKAILALDIFLASCWSRPSYELAQTNGFFEILGYYLLSLQYL